MTGKWVKLGRLYAPAPNSRHPKLLTHAANPLPIHLFENTYRIFYSGRDHKNRSSVGAVDIDIVRREVYREYDQPYFEHGPKGSFYADGVSIGNTYTVGDQTYMLFMGWQAPETGHWRGDIGRLIVSPELTLKLDQTKTPFMSIDKTDPISLSYPWVIENNGSQNFRMWYGSTRSWDSPNGEMVHIINAASSEDGHEWQREGLAVPFKIGQAQAFSRPTVVKTSEDRYEMWFSYRGGRGRTYRIGYAFSSDAKTWQLDLASSGIDVSENGWDSDMIEYPFVFDHLGQRYMLYNGNGFGKTGFGLATWK